ncbi:transcription-silencing protein Clr2-domain-containing protein [Chaetomium fimeti]|uniref:Transcription-silencing protein Clr2-domain-containing protein n=1 Tax=Chaetomium fimeti TaxID=1854472 RepID=A0AAE0LRK0_9PEZI|nr:transcription-silencing protein Clr2-domain-containing protein [Chaetomium fimeti]
MASTTAQQDASDYWPIHIARSDGQAYPNLDHSSLNPSEDQDVTQLERWEVIVAGHLQNQIAPKDDKKQYVLAGFPKGYELRCAVRKDGGRDYYLYGHPAGPKANYRTPGEFALHALWLVSDSADNSQCPCDLCPKYLEKAKPERERSQAPVIPPLAPAAAAAPGPAMAAQLSAAAQKPPQPHPQQQQQGQQQPQPQPQVPPPPPGTTSWTNVFRVGELVWYKHTAWRLGVVIAITPKPGIPIRPGTSDSSYHFTLAPLGHTLLEQASLIKDCQSMRPFLTFSVPNAGMEELKDKAFDTVNWQAMTGRLSQEPDPTKREINRQVLGLEASKMGARAINDAFSTFDLLAQGTTPDRTLHVQHYGGIYLGAEMIRIGDPVRVINTPSATTPAAGPAQPDLPPDANLVMLITEIQVLTPTSPPGARATLQFKGNLYRTIQLSPAHPAPPGTVPPAAEASLGAAFAEELATRNAIGKDKDNKGGGGGGGARWSWVQVAAQVLRGEQDVQGRFYVTEKLMSVIDPARLQAWVQRGMLEEAPAYLNNRGHSGGGQYVGRRPGRKATLGQAVGVEFRVPGGLVEN